MPISPELQAKIDSAYDPVKERIMRVLSLPREQRPDDEEVFFYCSRGSFFPLKEKDAQWDANPLQWRENVTPELLARIDAVTDLYVKTNIIRFLHNYADRFPCTPEALFDWHALGRLEARARRVLREERSYKWREDEVIAFIAHFKQEAPQMYADYLQQERNGRQIDADLAWDMRRLGEKWHPGLDVDDYRDLFSMVRDYAEAHLI
ncbi:hypothetical protein [Variovorax sp. DXTD-1]|uniref:hypothetical protein n=1 Tax=Variovorax sp. DXTD-1 TaxID=2495592 RepID=UPI000F86E3A1|nr:hypothetical protein [Variovorax sp. DXTD-1]RST48259.1 hypothetical protein EJI00_17270 [Variovorax sp. DXTD-1]